MGDITVGELKKIWEPAAKEKSPVGSSSFVLARPLNLYGAGNKSLAPLTTSEATVGKVRASRNDYTASEDDDVLVEGQQRSECLRLL